MQQGRSLALRQAAPMLIAALFRGRLSGFSQLDIAGQTSAATIFI
jgi:hypothetical protein